MGKRQTAKESERQPWSCKGKKGYLTWEHAANDAGQMRKKFTHGKHRRTMEPYRCRYCGCFHTGSREYLRKEDNEK